MPVTSQTETQRIGDIMTEDDRQPLRRQPDAAGGDKRETGNLIIDLLDCLHQPSPSHKNQWCVRPNCGRKFARIVGNLAKIYETEAAPVANSPD